MAFWVGKNVAMIQSAQHGTELTKTPVFPGQRRRKRVHRFKEKSVAQRGYDAKVGNTICQNGVVGDNTASPEARKKKKQLATIRLALRDGEKHQKNELAYGTVEYGGNKKSKKGGLESVQGRRKKLLQAFPPAPTETQGRQGGTLNNRGRRARGPRRGKKVGP